MTVSPQPIGQDEFNATIDETIAACDGDARAAVGVLLVTVSHLHAEIAERDAEMAKLLADLSRGYSRGRWQSLLERAEVPIPYEPGD